MTQQDSESAIQEVWRLFKETDKKFKETDKKITEVSRSVAALTGKWGRFVVIVHRRDAEGAESYLFLLFADPG